MSNRHHKRRQRAAHRSRTSHHQAGGPHTSAQAPTEIAYNPADFPPIMVAVPAMQWMWTKSAESLLALSHALPPGSAISISDGTRSTIAAARNASIEDFLSHPARWEWLMFVDSDMTLPPWAAFRLLSHQLDIVSGLSTMRHPPYRAAFGPLPGREGDVLPLGDPNAAPVAVDYVGGACLLIRRSVLERVPAPWFEHTMPGLGEDFVFCQKARAVGYTIHLDVALWPGHIEVRPVTLNDTVAHRNAIIQEEALEQTHSDRALLRAKGDAAAASAVEAMQAQLASTSQRV